MTTIGDITLTAPNVYGYGNYQVSIKTLVSTHTIADQLRELFAKCRSGTSIIDIPGSKPVGDDHTEDSVLTKYITFSHGNKAKDGYYLLVGFDMTEDPSPEGLEPVVDISLFYLGSTKYYQEVIRCMDMGKTTNDWE